MWPAGDAHVRGEHRAGLFRLQAGRGRHEVGGAWWRRRPAEPDRMGPAAPATRGCPVALSTVPSRANQDGNRFESRLTRA